MDASGEVVDHTVLEHLDLTIQTIDGQLETDVFAKDIPIYISKKSAHPPSVFSAVVKSVGMRLRLNCSLNQLLDPRIEEYTNYLLTSDYSRKEVEKVMKECKEMDREEMVRRPRRPRRQQREKKFALVTTWDPRAANVKSGLDKFKEILYQSPENRTLFPPGSIIPGFKRQQNLGEIIAPSKPVRDQRAQVQGGTFPCNAPRSCALHPIGALQQTGALQLVDRIQSQYDGVWHLIKRRSQCDTPSLIYHIRRPCGPLTPAVPLWPHTRGHTTATDYVGSTKDLKVRWRRHKWDIRHQVWEACGLTRHFAHCHQGNLEEAINNLQVTILDHLEGEYSEVGLKALEDRWMVNLGTKGVTAVMKSCHTRGGTGVELGGRSRSRGRRGR